jgi:hypothetical protein
MARRDWGAWVLAESGFGLCAVLRDRGSRRRLVESQVGRGRLMCVGLACLGSGVSD